MAVFHRYLYTVFRLGYGISHIDGHLLGECLLADIVCTLRIVG